MRDHNAQRPIYLIRVAQGQSRVADLEALYRRHLDLRKPQVSREVV